MDLPTITKDALVEITYCITDQDGNLLDNVSRPVNYLHRHKSGMFAVVEDALEGKKVGDKVEVDLQPEEGFGLSNQNLIYTDNINNVPDEYRHMGAEVEMHDDKGKLKVFTVTKISDQLLTLNGNHPLAGKILHFSLQVIAIRQATNDELSGIIPTGLAAGSQVKNIVPADQSHTLN